MADNDPTELVAELNELYYEALGSRPFYNSMMLAELSRRLAQLHVHYIKELKSELNGAKEASNMSGKMVMRLTDAGQAKYGRDVEQATTGKLRLARALQHAAFPGQAAPSETEQLAPLYLSQAVAAFEDPAIRAELSEALRELY